MVRCETAIVIPAFNEVGRLDRSILSLGLQLGIEPEAPRPAIVVVDNNSTDGTAEHARGLADLCEQFDLHVIDEPQPGISAACDTGFRYAIDELGASVIARIDADTVPMPLWYRTVVSCHAKSTRTRLLTGPVLPGFENDVRNLDRFLLPVTKSIGRAIKAVKYRQLGMIRFAPGHNMSTTAETFDAVGGFSHPDGLTDDVSYNLKVMQEFGSSAMGRHHNMLVYTSSRRLRELGYIGAARYYLSDKVQ